MLNILQPVDVLQLGVYIRKLSHINGFSCFLIFSLNCSHLTFTQESKVTQKQLKSSLTNIIKTKKNEKK